MRSQFLLRGEREAEVASQCAVGRDQRRFWHHPGARRVRDGRVNSTQDRERTESRLSQQPVGREDLSQPEPLVDGELVDEPSRRLRYSLDEREFEVFLSGTIGSPVPCPQNTGVPALAGLRSLAKVSCIGR